jgi:hypothetical protein
MESLVYWAGLPAARENREVVSCWTLAVELLSVTEAEPQGRLLGVVEKESLALPLATEMVRRPVARLREREEEGGK